MAKRNQQLQIRVTPAEKASIRAAAERSGMDMSSWILSRALTSPAAEIMALVDELDTESPMEAAAVWAELIELLQRLSPLEFDSALSLVRCDRLTDLAANYLAALVEMTAAWKRVRPPGWTSRIEPLKTPYFGTRLLRLREHLLFNAPVAFRRRNLFVDAGVGDRV